MQFRGHCGDDPAAVTVSRAMIRSQKAWWFALVGIVLAVAAVLAVDNHVENRLESMSLALDKELGKGLETDEASVGASDSDRAAKSQSAGKGSGRPSEQALQLWEALATAIQLPDEAQNRAVIDVLRQSRDDDGGEDSARLPSEDRDDPLPERLSIADRNRQVLAWLEANVETRRALTALLEGEPCGVYAWHSQRKLEGELPNCLLLHAVARLTLAEAQLLLDSGDRDGSFASVTRALRFGRVLGSDSSSIDLVIGQWIDKTGGEVLQRLAGDRPLRPAEKAELASLPEVRIRDRLILSLKNEVTDARAMLDELRARPETGFTGFLAFAPGFVFDLSETHFLAQSMEAIRIVRSGEPGEKDAWAAWDAIESVTPWYLVSPELGGRQRLSTMVRDMVRDQEQIERAMQSLLAK